MNTVIKATKRVPGAHSKLTKLRKEGQLAGVIYGYETESTPIVLNYRETERTVRKSGYASVFQIELEGRTINAVLADIQRCALKGHVRHVDFLAVNMEEVLEVDVPFTIVGSAIGVREGGVLTMPNHSIRIKVKPSNIPESIEVNVSHLRIGDTLCLGELRNKYDFAILNEDDYPLVTVTLPSLNADDIDLDEAEKTA